MRKQELKQINKQFYKYWMKEARDWRKNFLHVQIMFRRLSKLSYKTKEPLHETVERLLLRNKESVFEYDYSIIAQIVKIEQISSYIQMILELAGYEYKEISNEFYLIKERRGKVLNACNATSVCESSDMIYSKREKANHWLQDYYHKKHKKYESKRDKIALKYSSNAFKTEPANGERINAYSRNGTRVILCFVLLLFIILIYRVINTYLNPEEFEEATINKYNILLTASLPCIATLFTTYMLIQHEYRVDFHRERTGVLPVFSLELMEKGALFENNKLKKSIQKNLFNTAQVELNNIHTTDIYKLKNIGYGISFNTRHDRKDELFSFGDIPNGSSCYIAIKRMSSLYYTIEFNDIFGNKYTQFFDVEKEESGCIIASFPPELVLRTKRVRYQQ